MTIREIESCIQQANKLYTACLEKLEKQQTIISDLVTMVDALESKVNAQQRLLNILVFRAQESIIDLNETELYAMAELAENLKREGIELNV